MAIDKKIRSLQGKFHELSSGRKSYEILNAVPGIIFEIDNILVAKFGFASMELPALGLDIVITKSRKDGIELVLGWDNWSGFYIFSTSSEGDKLVTEIGTYFDTIIGGEDFKKYIDEFR